MSSIEYTSSKVRTATPMDMPILAAAIGESPETVISHHLLTSRTCDVWFVGDVRQPRAMIIQAHGFAKEPIIHGHDAGDAARIIPYVQGWETFSTPLCLVADLERVVTHARNTTSLRTLTDVYHVLDTPLAGTFEHPNVRLLTDDDLALTITIDEIQQDSAYKPIVAAAVIDGEIVSLAHTFAWSPLYVDIGVTTHEEFRQQGMASAAAALVAAEVQKRGKVPVWSTGSDNLPSMHIAKKLGFRETSRRLYLIPVEEVSVPISH